MLESRVLEYFASDYSGNEQLQLDITRLDLDDEFCIALSRIMFWSTSRMNERLSRKSIEY